MKNTKKTWKEWIYWFLFAIAVITVYKTLDNFTEITDWIGNLFKVVMPFLAGILIAYLLYVPCCKIEYLYKKINLKIIHRFARVLSIFTVYIIVILLLILGVRFVLPTLIESIIELTNFITNSIDTFKGLPEDSFFKSEMIIDMVDNIKNIDLKQFISVEKVTEYAKGAISIAGKIFDVFVSLIVSIYILLERKQILKFIKRLIGTIFEEKVYNNIRKYFNKSNEIFLRFVGSQFLDAIVVAILTSIAMSIMGVKYAVLLGVFIGLFNMIPYFGAIIAVAISIIITLFTGGLTQAIWMAVVVIILQQIDANIINPKIVGNSLKISPLLVVFGVTIGGAYFGVLGMFLAVPIIALIKICIIDYIELKEHVKEDKEIVEE